jgi:hypothetical protein
MREALIALVRAALAERSGEWSVSAWEPTAVGQPTRLEVTPGGYVELAVRGGGGLYQRFDVGESPDIGGAVDLFLSRAK